MISQKTSTPFVCIVFTPSCWRLTTATYSGPQTPLEILYTPYLLYMAPIQTILLTPHLMLTVH